MARSPARPRLSDDGDASPTSAAGLFGARLLLTSPFWLSGLMKAADYRGATEEMAAFGLPIPQLTAAAVIALQLAGSLAILLDRHARLGAAALVIFTLAATLLAHAFWSFPAAEQARQAATFTEHVGLVGGLGLAALLAGRRRAA